MAQSDIPDTMQFGTLVERAAAVLERQGLQCGVVPRIDLFREVTVTNWRGERVRMKVRVKITATEWQYERDGKATIRLFPTFDTVMGELPKE